MTSAEISKKIGQLNAEKTKLEKELEEALEREQIEREKKKFNDIKAAIHKLWDMYWKDEDNTESEKLLNTYEHSYQLEIWLDNDIKYALKKSKLADLEILKKIVEDCGATIQFDKAVEDAKIRLDFANALRNVRQGEALSGKLGWGFAPDDLMELMKLHKSNKFRKKIEDLLTDCNFHSECILLSTREYDKFEKYVMKDCQ